MLGFKTFTSACTLLTGIELMHMIYKGQFLYATATSICLSKFTTCSGE